MAPETHLRGTEGGLRFVTTRCVAWVPFDAFRSVALCWMRSLRSVRGCLFVSVQIFAYINHHQEGALMINKTKLLLCTTRLKNSLFVRKFFKKEQKSKKVVKGRRVGGPVGGEKARNSLFFAQTDFLPQTDFFEKNPNF